MAKTSMTVRLEQDLIDRLDALAERVGMTRTDVVERSIIAGLQEGEDLADKMENPVIRGVVESILYLDRQVTAEDKANVRKAMGNIKKTSRKKKGPKRA